MKKLLIWIFIIGLLAVGGFFGWRYWQKNRAQAGQDYQTTAVQRGNLTAYIGATGTVRPNQTAVIAWQTNGRIASITATPGENVQEGEILAELAGDSLSQALILAEADLINARRALDELLNSDVARAQSQLALAQAQDALEKAQNQRASKEYARASNTTIDSARATYVLAQDAVDNAKQFYDQFSSFPENDVNRAAALASLSTAIQQRDRALAQLNWLLGKPDTGEIALADANLTLAEANLKAAEREWQRLQAGPDPADVRAAEVRILAIENTLNLVYIKAPFLGMITESNSQVGDLVAPGTISFRIDDLSRLLVDVQVPEVDINRIQPDQIAKISFDAIQEREYTGKVIDVARVGSLSPSGVDFNVTIELLDADESVRPAMTAAVNIVVNQLEDVLIVPNRTVRLRDGKRVIFILDQNILKQVEVQIGASSDTFSEIVAGEVKEGDLLVLNPPALEMMNGSPFGGP